MNDFIARTLEYWTAGGLLLLPLAGVCLAIWITYLRSQDRIVRIARAARRMEKSFSSQPSATDRAVGPLNAFWVRVQDDIAAGTPARQAFQQRGDECVDSLRNDLLLLGALTAVAPLLGLLGTVVGMIGTFDAVANLSGSTGGNVAGGISQALITTQVGLVVALPGVFGLSRLRSLLRDAEAGLGALRATALARFESIPSGEPA